MPQFFRPISPIQWSWISIKGPDAADFIHRLTTVNVKPMKSGEGSPGFFLTPQGKMRAYFQLWMISREDFFFELDPGTSGRWKEELLKVIDQFHFGEKLSIETTSPEELSSVWVFGESDAFPGLNAGHLQETAGIKIFNHGAKDFGKTWFTLWGNSTETLQQMKMQEIGIDEVEAMRISAGRPRVDSELTENTIPLEAGLRDGIADNKGCYPGQEVIEKIISLGAPARRLAKIEGTGTPPSVGDSVKTAPGKTESETGGQEIGKITSVSANGNQFLALAFIRKTHAKEGLEISIGTQSSPAKLVWLSP